MKIICYPLLALLCLTGIAEAQVRSTTPAPAKRPNAGAVAPRAADAEAAKQPKSQNELYALKLLDEAKAKIMGLQSLTVEAEVPTRCHLDSSKNFEKTTFITLARPNKFRLDRMDGVLDPKPVMSSVSNGSKVTRLVEGDAFIAYEKPVRTGAFFMGHNFMVQFFFDPKPIRFDPTDPIWEKSVSLFDKNYAAYDKYQRVKHLGKRSMEDVQYDVVEIKYNTPDTDIRQHIYIDSARMIGQVDTFYGTEPYYQKYRNYRTQFLSLGPDTFRVAKPDKMQVIETDPARLGETTPGFTLPGAKGEPEISLQKLLTNSKGVLVATLSGREGPSHFGPDTWLEEMKLIQEIKTKFEPQGLKVVVIMGDATLTPDLKDELLLNWMPDLSRFDYPIAIDIDVERGIQGSAYENFQLNGRRSLLLDAKGRVVFACNQFSEKSMAGKGSKSNLLSLYQAMSQIGFTVSQADLDSALKK